MDGVLIDSSEVNWNAHNKLLGHHGVHLGDDEIKLCLGRSLRDSINNWNEKYGLSLDLNSHTEASFAIQLKTFEKMNADSGLVAFLKNLKLNNVEMGVGTSSQKFRAEKILQLLKLKEYFSVLVTANDVHKHKPHPDVYLKTAELLKVEPKYCVVFEDAVDGIISAKSAGMKVVGIITKYHSEEELHEADLVIKNFSEVNLTKLKKLF